ncbi:hypothetical protein RI367_003837 [Sorochytrium milnesiophthora]
MDLACLWRRLPVELRDCVLELAGVEVCAAFRGECALTNIVKQYRRTGQRRPSDEKRWTDACLAAKWSAGVQLLVDHGIQSVFTDTRPRQDLVDIVVSADSLHNAVNSRLISQEAVAVLAYNLMARNRQANRRLPWCISNPQNAVAAVGAEVLWRGGSLKDLRAYCEHVQFPSDMWTVTSTFMDAAAESGQLDVLRKMDAAVPSLIEESQSLLLSAARGKHLSTVQYVFGRVQCDQKATETAIVLALRGDALDVAKWLYEQPVAKAVSAIVDSAVLNGHLEFVKQLHADGAIHDSIAHRCIKAAATHGQLETLQWLSQQFQPHSAVGTYHAVATAGHWQVLEWMLGNMTPCYRKAALIGAATGGHLELVKLLYHRHPTCRNAFTVVDAIVAALDNCHLAPAQWLASQTPDLTLKRPYFIGDSVLRPYYISGTVLREGHLDIVQWAHQYPAFQGMRMPSVELATASGNVAFVRWLCDRYGEAAYATLDIEDAAASGSLAMVQWVTATSTRSSDDDCATAAVGTAVRSGNLEMVRWINEHIKLGDKDDAMNIAAEHGHLEVLKYLHADGTWLCTTRAMDMAAFRGHLQVVEWLHHNRTEGCTVEAMDSAAGRGDIEMVRFLHEHRSEGCTTSAADLAAAGGHIHVLRFLFAERDEGWTENAAVLAAKGGHLPVLEFLAEHQDGGCPRSGMAGAALEGRLHIVKWLHEHGKVEGCTSKVLDAALRDVRAWFKANKY